MEIEVESVNSLKENHEHDKLLNENIIREWLAENRKNLEKCYPTVAELENLAKKTGNSVNKVNLFLSRQRLKILVKLNFNDSCLKRNTKNIQSGKDTASYSMAENTKSEVKSDNSVNERKYNLDERQINLIFKYLTENWKNLEKCYPADTELNNIAKTIGATKEEVNSFLSNNRLKFLINLKREDKNLKKYKNHKSTQDSSVKSQQEQQSLKKLQQSKLLEKPKEDQPSRQQNKPEEGQLSRQQGKTKEQQKMPRGYQGDQQFQQQKMSKEPSQLQKDPKEPQFQHQKKTKEQPSQQQEKPKNQQSEPLEVPQLCRILQRQQCKYTTKNTPSWQQQIYSDDTEELLEADSSHEDLLVVDKGGSDEENSSKCQNHLNLLMQENAEEKYLNVQQVANKSEEELMSDHSKNMKPEDDEWKELIMANKLIIFPETTERSLDTMN